MNGGCSMVRIATLAALALALALTAPAAAAAAPSVTITGGPDGVTNQTEPVFTFETTPTIPDKVTCWVDEEAPGTCGPDPSSHRAGPLNEGVHTFHVLAEHAGESTEATRTFEVDLTPPTIALFGGDDAPSTDPTPSYSMTADEPVHFACRIDGGRWYHCGGLTLATDHTIRPVEDGRHLFETIALDAAFNASNLEGSWFEVDTAFPVSRIGGFRRTRDRTPTFTLSADPGSTFRCSFDGGAFRPCASPVTLGPLRRGMYTFEVLATDPAGNEQPVPTFVRLRIIPLPCSAYLSQARRVACRCSKLRRSARRRLCRCNRFRSKAKRSRCRASVNASRTSAPSRRAAGSGRAG